MMIFRRKKKSEDDRSLHESHMKNLMVLAMADGHLSEIEEHLLLSIAHRHGLSEADIENIKVNLSQISFVLPKKYDERIEQFNDLLTLMSVDGKIDPDEERVCREIAKKYELMGSVVDEMIMNFK